VTEALRPPPHLDAEVFTREAANSGTRILDARSDSESFDAGHFPHAIHAPLKSSFFSTSAGSYLAASDSILLVLENGNDAYFAARQLYRIGSIKSWVGLPLRRRRRMDCSRLVSNE
jgi:rhodanese-related sulfurtransferase